ncbi:MAG: hypothetical protein J6V90_04390 [Treponema sp.]|nr:hypothetical protein [Treponema sp.]
MAKEQFKKFSKGFLLGTAMMTAVGSGIVATSCSQPAGSSIPYVQPTPTPTPTPDPNDPNNGGNGGNGGQQQEDEAEKFGGAPYDATNVTLGTGYKLHVFMGKNTAFLSNDKEKADYYINQAEAHVKDLANKLNESTEGRPEAQAYFSQMVSKIQSEHYYGSGMDFDAIINNVSRETAKIMGEIAKNTDDEVQCYDFNVFYRAIANEATKAGAGSAFTGSDSATRYNEEKTYLLNKANNIQTKQRLNIDLQQAYDSNNFTAVTNFVDTCLANAAQKIGHGVTADDLRQVVNMAMTTEAMGALHARSKVALSHNTNCTLDLGMIKRAIDPSNYYAMLNQKQDKGIELC